MIYCWSSFAKNCPNFPQFPRDVIAMLRFPFFSFEVSVRDNEKKGKGRGEQGVILIVISISESRGMIFSSESCEVQERSKSVPCMWAFFHHLLPASTGSGKRNLEQLFIKQQGETDARVVNGGRTWKNIWKKRETEALATNTTNEC